MEALLHRAVPDYLLCRGAGSQVRDILAGQGGTAGRDGPQWALVLDVMDPNGLSSNCHFLLHFKRAEARRGRAKPGGWAFRSVTVGLRQTEQVAEI